jgi:AAA domain
VSLADDVVSHLQELKFEVEQERLDLFGEALPLLRAVAVDPSAQQLVLVAEQEQLSEVEVEDEEYVRPWRELLFAVSGLRHHLRASALPALSTPILFAVVDSDGAYRLRELVEKIANEYVLFTRLDITIVETEKVAEDESALELLLAPVLPRVRKALKGEVTVATQDVERFWHELHGEIRETAGKIARDFGDVGIADAADRVMGELRNGDSEESPERGPIASPQPVSQLILKNFRSFGKEEVNLAPLSLVYGANGSGKTSVCEALEIAWSGGTQRMPYEEVELADYERHLQRDGKEFLIRAAMASGEGKVEATELTRADVAPLGRVVLAQHTLAEMVDSTPKDRLRAFRRVSGLALPELEKERTDTLRRTAFTRANEALEEVGIEPMRAVNNKALTHVRRIVKSDFSEGLASPDHLEGAVETLVRATGGLYVPPRKIGQDLAGLLRDVDVALDLVARDLGRAPDPSPQIDAAVTALRDEAERLRAAADPLRMLAQQVSRAISAPPETKGPVAPAPSSPVPPETAARWLGHVRGLEQSVVSLDSLVPGIDDKDWRQRLEAYAAALRAALSRSSVEQLERLVKEEQSLELPPQISAGVAPELVLQAGFRRPVEWSRAVVAAIGELQVQLSDRAALLDALAADISRHPGPSLVSRAARVMPPLFHFEVVKELMNPRGALVRAQETLVSELLDERLFPVVRELVAALVRFEWYFKPLGMHADKGGVHMSGLANDDETQDVRFLLNAAERTVVGIAWFLALHILQDEDDRQVLVLDDPASGFDSTNKAAFVATLRAVLRLLKPKQVLITTHDDALVALLQQEFAPISDWPESFEVRHCRRTDSEESKIEPASAESGMAQAADLSAELRKLAFEPDDLPSLL